MGQPRQGVQQPIPLNDEELAAYQAKVDEEWGVWIADPKGPGIFYNGALAYTPGSAVPVSNVKKYSYDKSGQVVKRVPDPEPPAPPAKK